MNNTTHARGAALRAAIANNLKDIYFGKADLGEILAEAEELYAEIQGINMGSLRNITANYKEDQKAATRIWFDTCPSYLKEIITAVTIFKCYSEERPEEIAVETIKYKPQSLGGMSLSHVVRLALKGNPEKQNEDLRFFGFQLKKMDKMLVAVITDWDTSYSSNIDFMHLRVVQTLHLLEQKQETSQQKEPAQEVLRV